MRVEKLFAFMQPKHNFDLSKKQDLTSFGAQEPASKENPIISKHAALAIKNQHISFKGHTENIYYGMLGTDGVVSIGEPPENNYGIKTIRLYDKRGNEIKEYNVHSTPKEDMHYREDSMLGLIGQNKSSYANSSIENTKNHNKYETKRIYFADPEEFVDYQTKRDHDYIVYDNRPKYPKFENVKQNYLNPNVNATNYGADFRTIAEYYYRLERADKEELKKLTAQKEIIQKNYDESLTYKKDYDAKKQQYTWEDNDLNKDKEKADYFHSKNEKELNEINQKIGYYTDRVNFSRDQQQKAIQAFNLFNEVGLIFMDRDRTRDHIHYILHGLGPDKERVKESTAKIKRLKEEKSTIEQGIETTQKWLKITKARMERKGNYYDGSKYLNMKIKNTEDLLDDYKSSFEAVEEELKEEEWTLKYFKTHVETEEKNLPKLQKRYEETKKRIMDLYPKMEEFYRNNVQDWQCQ